MKEIYGYLIAYGYISIVFLFCFIVKKIFKSTEETTRKIIHIAVCFTWILMENYLVSDISKVIIPLSFVFFNWLSLKYNLISVMERENNCSYGTVYYALSLTLMNFMCLFSNELVVPCGIGLFVLSFGDGFAAIIGKKIKRYNFNIKKGKSIMGTIACFCFSMIGMVIFSIFVPVEIAAWKFIIIGLAATAFEMIGGKYDNIIIPIGVMLIAYVLI